LAQVKRRRALGAYSREQKTPLHDDPTCEGIVNCAEPFWVLMQNFTVYGVV